VTASQQRAAAEHLTGTYQISQRRSGLVLGRARSTLRYSLRKGAKDEPLIKAIRRLARRYLRYGYKRIHALLVRQGFTVNRKRVRRLWNELGLRRPFRRGKPRQKAELPGTSANSCTNQPARFKNDVWTYDFVADRTADGRP